MKIIDENNKITRSELREMAKKMYDNLVKGVIDVEKEILVVNGELHSDEQELLIEQGSDYKNLWGINIYPEKEEDWIEFDSVINLKPAFGNRTRGIEDEKIREKIIKIIDKLVIK